MNPATTVLGAARWRQLVFITLGAVALYGGFRILPTGTNLNHMDFRVAGTNSIEFCDALNPQFIPVVAVRSPVTMTLTPDNPDVPPDVETRFTLVLKTSSGKAIAPEDLLVTHTRKLHLLIIDPWLNDYQHVHPEPGRNPGEWTFAFTPHRSGPYRVFADFTPVATARGLYASVDLNVGGARLPAGMTMVMQHALSWTAEHEGYRFVLIPGVQPVRARQPVDLRFEITRADGAPVPLETVMGAYAHLVAFDEARSGFAHLHPTEADLLKRPDVLRPVMDFKVTIPSAGRYVIWAQINLGGREVFVPFWFEVEE
ncbi:MAG: hypothetical protein KA257_09990 [Opitutaceae bacterium]|nr:hypothetical protein [Opitutaceae bacterium]MBP9912326.1 hypothetical protein [Opitutaceae bacterium]